MKKIIVFLFLFFAVFIVMGASLQPPLHAEELTTTAQEETTTTTTAEEATTSFSIPEWILTDPAFLALLDNEAVNQLATILGINVIVLAVGLFVLFFVIKWLKKGYEIRRAGNQNSVETQRLLEEHKRQQELIIEVLAMLGVQNDRVLPAVSGTLQAILAIAKTSKNDDLRALVPSIEESAIAAQNALTASANALPNLLKRSSDGIGKLLNLNTDNIPTIGKVIAEAIEKVKAFDQPKAV